MAGLAWQRLRPRTLGRVGIKGADPCQRKRFAALPLRSRRSGLGGSLQPRRREAPLRQRTSTGSCFTLGAPSDADLDFKGVIHIPPRNRRILHFPGITARYFWIYETLVVGGEPSETY